MVEYVSLQKEIEATIEELEALNVDYGVRTIEEIKASDDSIDRAINSLKAWHSVIDELRRDVNFDNIDDKVEFLKIIDKHIKGVQQ